ncbi:LysM peptidoglycan-binding domain-containing protein [Bacillus tuaregi]|uniref:LysM peptidoglycan-binding domain-containing protein n=1 Tax=Bacillus tuaregi TaxID=1816695 RepID=UPI000B1AA3BD|nr:LysM peptidoglycan-binding domain-containing protein [Bacillus tuaregi]
MMRKSSAFVCILMVQLLLLHAPAPVDAVKQDFSHLYEVRAGDSLPVIADKYGTTVEELKATNGLISDSLRIGQRLFVPMMYEVMTGDTLDKIANTYNSTVELIQATNGLSSSELEIGQILKIPPKRLTMQGQYIVMTREEFQDWLFHQVFTRKISLIQQHHTWLPSYKHFYGNNHFSMLKGMETFHMRKMGWSNIAQNITTFPDGKIAVCRPFDVAPDGTIGPTANSVGIAIEHIGNFDLGHDVMTAEQKETIVYITALLCMKFGLAPSIDSITYHHWWSLKTKQRVLDNGPEYDVKTCPGTAFFGGNTTQSATNYFYPLVVQKMQEIRASMKQRY